MKMSMKYLLVIILALLVLESDCSCVHGDVHLVGGSGNYEGNVQVCIDGVWGYVCDNSWNSNDAQVVCRQLGYNTTDLTYKIYSYYGYGNGTIWMDYVYCTGSEDKLIDCPTSNKIGMTNCGYNEMAGVYCAFGVGGSNCTNGDIRLAHYSTSSYYGRSEGRVEVCYNNEWGTVCSNGWDSTDATVACKQLSYTGYIKYYTYNYYGIGSGSIWLDDLSCSSSYSSLFDCSYSTSTNDCTHSNDVQVRCYSTDSSSCTNGDVKLWSVYDSTPDNEGIPLVCISGTWYPMHDGSYCYSYILACKAAGYSGLKYYSGNGGRYHGYYYKTHYRFYCSSSASNLNSCSKTNYSSSVSWDDSVRVRCYTDQQTAYCTEGSVRLVNGGASNEGRAEYCYNNAWAPICSMNQYSAHLICTQLGYGNDYFLILLDEFGKSDTISQFYYLYCNSASTSLSECSVQISSCSAPSCNKHYGLRCHEPTNECNVGETRLVDGQIEQEGRPEVCVNGIWGQICDNGWSVNDAYVICVTLGYTGTLNPTVYLNSEFGVGYSPIVWSYVDCNHWNIDIHDCSKTVFPNFNCDSYNIAGVRCTEGCTDGDVRLVGGSSVNVGTVEICFDELWGLISDDGWDDVDARLVCEQLGYTWEDAKPVLGSYYGKPNKTIHVSRVSCSSLTTSWKNCSFTKQSLSNGKELWFSADVVGVQCNVFTDTTTSSTITTATPTATSTATPSTATPLIPSCILSQCSSKGSVRLTDSASNNGRIEYCDGTYRTHLCYNDNSAATVICMQLGYTSCLNAWNAQFDYGDDQMETSSVQDITCSGNEQSLIECNISKSSNGCMTCNKYITGLKCCDASDLVPCNEGSVKLVNGSSDREGRVEVCVNGVWGSVCDDGWDSTDGHIVCHQLGYTREEPTMYYDSYFGDGSYPVVYSNVNCKGWEDSISDCDKDDHLSFTCYPGDTAGLRCNGDLVEEDPSGNSTTIEVVSNDSGESVVTVVGVTLGAVSLVAIISAVVALIFMHYRRSTSSQRRPVACNETMRANDLNAREEPSLYEEVDLSSNPCYLEHKKQHYYYNAN